MSTPPWQPEWPPLSDDEPFIAPFDGPPEPPPLPAPPEPEIDLNDPQPLIPARMINEISYCPRLFALEWLQAEWADNHHTVEGRTVHKRVDAPTRKGLLPLDEPTDQPADAPTADEAAPRVVRSVLLSDSEVGIVARIDLCEQAGDRVVPVDYKKGKAPDIPEGAWEPERVQICAQALLLRAHGYTVEEGALWFDGSKSRVPVPITPALVARTLELRDKARRLARCSPETLPPPLVDSPKCRGCSLVGICLPDEINVLTGKRTEEVRPLVPGRDDGLPLYVLLQGGSIGKTGGEIVVREKGSVVGRARFNDTSQVVMLGNATVSTALLAALSEADIPLAVHSTGGWYRGSFMPLSGVGALLRVAQHRAADDPARALELARAIVINKIRNQRVLLRRNGGEAGRQALPVMAAAARAAESVSSLDALLGQEGNAARAYFGSFQSMLRADLGPEFQMNGRSRRPPRDPVNALLSFAYACLSREWTQILRRVGFDAERGFLHQMRHGRPALALDMMEPFRPLIADSTVITAVNTGVVTGSDFLVHPTGVALTDAGRRRFIQAWERRLDELATHGETGTRLSMRRMFELHARLWARHLHGELAQPPMYLTR